MKLYSLYVLLFLNNISYGQSTESKCASMANVASMDFSAIIITGAVNLNYERYIVSVENIQLLINGGVGGWYYIFAVDDGVSSPSFSLSLNTLTGCKVNHFEFDLGARYLLNSKDKFGDNNSGYPFHFMNSMMKNNIYPIANIGFRHQSVKNSVYRVFFGLSGLGFGYGTCF